MGLLNWVNFTTADELTRRMKDLEDKDFERTLEMDVLRQQVIALQNQVRQLQTAVLNLKAGESQ